MQLTEDGIKATETFLAAPPAQQEEMATQMQAGRPDLFSIDDDKSKEHIWITLLIGMFVLALASVGGTIALSLQGEETSALIAVATAVVAGLFGLFVNSPTR